MEMEVQMPNQQSKSPCVITIHANHSYIPANQSYKVYIYIELRPGTDVISERRPLNFSLVLDRSGSMVGEKIQTVKAAVKNMIDLLESDDIFSVVTFAERPQVFVPAQRVLSKENMKRWVERIDTGAATNLAPALKAGIEQVKQNLSHQFSNRVVLLTDGEATDSEEDSRQLADTAGREGVEIIGMGFGRDWKEDFLIDLADRSKQTLPGSRAGSVYYIQNPGQVSSVFGDVYHSMQIAMLNITLTVRLAAGVEALQVWEVVPQIREIGAETVQGCAVVVPISELRQSGAAYLIEVMLPSQPAGLVRAAQADAAYILDERRDRQPVELLLQATLDPSQVDTLNPAVMNVLDHLVAYQLGNSAIREVEIGDAQAATRKLRAAVSILLDSNEVELAQQWEQEIKNLEQNQEISPEGRKTIKLTSRQTIHLNDIHTD